ncbi:MAG TPA: TlpA family protein disulfide reductase [Clostridiaceae bacterium]|nr:TlpA family protein disulfide reductase [Clostridiaceae bacterium]
MKKTITILLLLLFSILAFSACSAKKDEIKNTNPNATKEKQTINIINQNPDALERNTVSEAGKTNQQLESSASDSSAQQTVAIENSESASDNIWFFESTDLAGNEFNSQEYFANGKLTLVNIWATWCPPCRIELPDLGKLAKDFAEQKVQFLGIATDVDKDNQKILDIAKSLLSDSAVEYPNVIFNEQTNNIMVQNQIQSLPTTILIDANGNVIGDFIAGMRNYDKFSNLIDSALDQIQ